jgi:predicted DNA-binding transcriptional regulator AlpA
MPDRLLTTRQLAARLQVSLSQLYAMRYAGTAPPAIRIGGTHNGHLRFRESSVEKYLAEREEPTPQSA